MPNGGNIKRGVGVWVAGFLAFIAGINVINAVLLWSEPQYGPYGTFTPYLIGEYIGEIQVETYFWLSVALTFAFLGLAVITTFRGTPQATALRWASAKVEQNLITFRKDLLTFLQNLSATREEDGRAVKSLGRTMRTLKRDLSEGLENNRKAGEKLLKKVDTRLDSTGKDVLDTIETQGQAIRKVDRTSAKIVAALKKHKKELDGVEARLHKLEAILTPQPPKLTSRNNPEEIRGIGPRLGKELRSLGITNVGELLTANPDTVAEKAGNISSDKMMQWQTLAQLQMIPGISEKDADLLEEVGIRSRKELAGQDPVELRKKIEENGKISEDEKPTIEEVAAWIKLAKL